MKNYTKSMFIKNLYKKHVYKKAYFPCHKNFNKNTEKVEWHHWCKYDMQNTKKIQSKDHQN